MKTTLFVIGLILLSLCAAGQQSANSDEFHWDSHNWQELSWKQSISRRHLPKSQREVLIGTIVEQMREDGASDEHRTDKELRQIAAETRIAFVDLTGHGRKDIIARAGGENSDCSPTGNCSLWVLRHQRDGYHVILDADSKQTFAIQSSSTNGFNNLVLGMHGSAFETGLSLYKFDGSRYKEVACYDANSQVLDEQGNARYLREPRITPCP